MIQLRWAGLSLFLLSSVTVSTSRHHFQTHAARLRNVAQRYRGLFEQSHFELDKILFPGSVPANDRSELFDVVGLNGPDRTSRDGIEARLSTSVDRLDAVAH